MKQILVLVFALVTALSARAQDVGFVAGIANNSASTDTVFSGLSVDSDLGYRLGINVMMDLADRVNFRTGVMYTYRPISMTGTNTDLDVKMSYIDIPVLFQFAFNNRISLFAGPVVGIKAGEKIKGTLGGIARDENISDLNTGKDAKSIYLLGQVGLNFNFDGIGFDVYYEKGFGQFVEDTLKDYSNVGANFVYWF